MSTEQTADATDLRNIEVYEIAMAENPAQDPLDDEGSFLLLKEKGADSTMTDNPEEKEEENEETAFKDALKEALEEADESLSEGLVSKVIGAFAEKSDSETNEIWSEFSDFMPEETRKSIAESLLQKGEAPLDEDLLDSTVNTLAELADVSTDEVWKEIGELMPEDAKEDLTKDEEQEKALSPKAQNAIKQTLDNLSEVRAEIPSDYQWVFSALAKLAGYPSPYGEDDYKYPKDEYGYPKMAEKEVSGEAKEVVEEGLNTLEKIEDLPEELGWVVDALKQITKEQGDMMEKENIEEYVDEEVQPVIKEMQEENKELEKEVEKLKEEKLEKELKEQAKEFENLPTETDDLVELFKELHGSETFDKVTNLLSKLEKEVENSELFKSKGETGNEGSTPSSSTEKIEKEAEKLMDKEDISKPAAMTRVLKENDELRKEHANELRGGR